MTEKAKEVVKIGNHIKGATAGVISFPFGGMDEKKEEKAEAKKEDSRAATITAIAAGGTAAPAS